MCSKKGLSHTTGTGGTGGKKFRVLLSRIDLTQWTQRWCGANVTVYFCQFFTPKNAKAEKEKLGHHLRQVQFESFCCCYVSRQVFIIVKTTKKNLYVLSLSLYSFPCRRSSNRVCFCCCSFFLLRRRTSSGRARNWKLEGILKKK